MDAGKPGTAARPAADSGSGDVSCRIRWLRLVAGNAVRKGGEFAEVVQKATPSDCNSLRVNDPIIMTGGEGGIRTPGRSFPLRRFSKPLLSTTQPPLLEMNWSVLSIVPYDAEMRVDR